VKDDQPTNLYGQFWSHNSYVIAYTYGPPTDPTCILYFWLGRNSTKNEKGTCAALALNLAKKRHGATQVRIPQHKETRHFLKIFGGKLIIHRGNQREEAASSKARLYRVRGNDEWSTSAVEVEATSSSINTNCSFVLVKEKQTTVWIGKNASKFSQTVAKDVANTLVPGQSPTVINEGSETNDFWNEIGGKQTYMTDVIKVNPKFFWFSNATGMVTAEYIWNFTQEDLQSEIVALLDSQNSVFLWTGSKARETDKKIAMETALDYVQKATDGRTKNTPILNIKEGAEPVNFVSHFHGWEGSSVVINQPTEHVAEALKEYTEKLYSYDELKKLKEKDKLPKSVDKSELERYLVDDEFKKLTGMDKEAWKVLPAWKKGPIKKQLGLF